MHAYISTFVHIPHHLTNSPAATCLQSEKEEGVPSWTDVEISAACLWIIMLPVYPFECMRDTSQWQWKDSVAGKLLFVCELFSQPIFKLETQVDTDCWDQLIQVQLSGSGDWAPCELDINVLFFSFILSLILSFLLFLRFLLLLFLHLSWRAVRRTTKSLNPSWLSLFFS